MSGRQSVIVITCLFFCMLPFGTMADSSAIEPIEEAFGMRLGATFAPSNVPDHSTTINETPAYYFAPHNPSRLFDFYVVQITPATHLIHTIIAIGRTQDVDTCHEQRSNLMVMLTKRYGPSTKSGTDHGSTLDIDYEVIVQHRRERGVGVICGGTSPTIFQMLLVDDALADLAEHERLELADKHAAGTSRDQESNPPS